MFIDVEKEERNLEMESILQKIENLKIEMVRKEESFNAQIVIQEGLNVEAVNQEKILNNSNICKK